MSSGAQLSARTSELGLGGCYIDVLNPFPKGTLVQLRILRDQGVFKAKAKVVYCDERFGMGIAFTGITPDQELLLEVWLAELVVQLKPASQVPHLQGATYAYQKRDRNQTQRSCDAACSAENL